MRRGIIIVIAFLLISEIWHLRSGVVWAQQVSLGMSPPIVEAVIKPGKAIMVAFTLENKGDPAIFKSKIVSFEPSDNIGNIKFKPQLDGPLRFALDNSNIAFGDSFFLKTGGTQQLLLRMRVPEGTPEGDYYYTLLAEMQPQPTSEGETAPRVQGTIGSNILITVTETGQIDIKGKVPLFEVLPTWKIPWFGHHINLFDSNDLIPLDMIVGNYGKNVIAPQGTITLKGNFGETAQYDILPLNILAHSERLMEATPTAQLACDGGDTRKVCNRPHSLVLSGFFVGNYKLSAQATFGEGTPNVYASTSFLAIPFKYLLGLLIIIILTVYVLKKFSREKEDDDSHDPTDE